GQERLFEISDRRNDFAALMAFIYWMRENKQRGFGFNNVGFDYEILHFMATNGADNAPAIYQKVQAIFATQNRFGGGVWESDRLFEQVDLFKIWHYDNPAKSTSLKALEI